VTWPRAHHYERPVYGFEQIRMYHLSYGCRRVPDVNQRLHAPEEEQESCGLVITPRVPHVAAGGQQDSLPLPHESGSSLGLNRGSAPELQALVVCLETKSPPRSVQHDCRRILQRLSARLRVWLPCPC